MNRMARIVVALLAAATSTNAIARVTKHHVNANASPNGNGLTWQTAYDDLQDALARAKLTPGADQIWVAAGTYYPDGGTGDRTLSFDLVDDTRVLGGFEYGDSDITDRDPLNNVTTLSGDLGGGDYSYHVITSYQNTETAVIEGFTIKDGRADDPNSAINRMGGGAYFDCSEAVIVNCIFTNNTAGARGTDCVNDEGLQGLGGAIALDGSPCGEGTTLTRIQNCVFFDNVANSAPEVPFPLPGKGGAVYSGGTDLQMANCLFYDNLANEGCGSGGQGGAIFSEGTGSLELINCTIVDNESRYAESLPNIGVAGGLYATNTVTATNCVFWGNEEDHASVSNWSDQLIVPLPTEDITYCNIESDPSDQVFSGTGNIEEEPDFVTGQYRLTFDSPCLDAGNMNAITGINDEYDLNRDGATTGIIPDLDLAVRRTGLNADMGAYEFQCTGTCPADFTGPSSSGCNHVPDGNVNSLDYLLLVAEWGSPCNPGGCTTCASDITGPTPGVPDGNVDSLDYTMLIAQWGTPGRCDCTVTAPAQGSGSNGSAAAASDPMIHGLTAGEWDTLIVASLSAIESEQANGICWTLHYLSECGDDCAYGGCGGVDPLDRH
jgi:hypothetical protein